LHAGKQLEALQQHQEKSSLSIHKQRIPKAGAEPSPAFDVMEESQTSNLFNHNLFSVSPCLVIEASISI
jgi:hypothetical protein